jgi:predicted protein tyrosine phosphatase
VVTASLTHVSSRVVRTIFGTQRRRVHERMRTRTVKYFLRRATLSCLTFPDDLEDMRRT